jgi:DNA transposition AAA+ family ATPase
MSATVHTLDRPAPDPEQPAASPLATVETADLRRATKLARAIMQSRTRIGRLVGEPGTGKTHATHWICDQLGRLDDPTCARTLRLCARRGLTEAALVRAVATGLGCEYGRGESTDAILDAAGARAAGVLIVIDEANHLRWQHLERLRWLSDEAGAGILLVGTDLLSRTFRDGRNRIYLAQLASRIGGKQHEMGQMDARQAAAYVLTPRFGAVTQRVAEAFAKAAGGYWRDLDELASACTRILQVEQQQELTIAVVHAAAKSLAERS